MTNPNNAIGTNAAYSGRTSVNAFNDDLAAYSRGVLSGWNCQVDTGLTVLLGGGNSVRDVAIAEDNAGNKTTINNISLDEVSVTLDTAPGANSRIDAIVAYVDNPPQGSDSTADNPEACGIIPVAGTPAVDPQAPDDNAIRTAITADGASGTTAYYVVLATVTVPTGTTDLIPGYIQQGDKAILNANQIADGSITSPKIDFATISSWGNMQTASQQHNLNGTGMGVTLFRIGNLVTVNGNPVIGGHSQADSETYNPAWGLIPLGYRPKYTSRIILTGVVPSSATAGWDISPDGKKNWSTPGWAGNERFFVNTWWITEDPWPAEE